MLPPMMQIDGVMSTSSSRRGGKKKNFKMGTFNVRGLSKDSKQKQLSRDFNRYGLDILCIHETKMKELQNTDVGGNRLICLESNSPHYGNGFMVSKRWKNNIYKFWRVNDRISVLQLQTEKTKVQTDEETQWRSRTTGETTIKLERNIAKDHIINIINVYAPTSDKVENNENIVQSFYTTNSRKQ